MTVFGTVVECQVRFVELFFFFFLLMIRIECCNFKSKTFVHFIILEEEFHFEYYYYVVLMNKIYTILEKKVSISLPQI